MVNEEQALIKHFSPSRNIVVDALREGMKMHHAFGWGEVDITDARKKLETWRLQKGETLSFTAFVLCCVGKAVDEFKEVQAVRKGNKIIIFNEIDVSTLVERSMPDGRTLPATVIIRRVNMKSFKELNDEIREAQRVEFDGISLGKSKQAKQANFFSKLPQFIRNILWWKVRRDPDFRKKILGTAQVTAVGMFGTKGGYAMTPTPWPLSIIVGGIVKRPGYNGDRIEPRDYLCLTIGVDHDVVDGGPGARFIARLVQLLEQGEGLP
jgi:pyruvate/2-oxoglutarate dehydrogenase complex dihydrolipoamide acyltransferase (E2) component